jgi:DNA-binding XRE family transcriptional regulator
MAATRKKPARLGEKLRAVREKFGFSLSEMAAKVSDDEVSIYRQDVHRYENNQTDPSLIILLRYARLARVKMEIFADDKLDLPK